DDFVLEPLQPRKTLETSHGIRQTRPSAVCRAVRFEGLHNDELVHEVEFVQAQLQHIEFAVKQNRINYHRSLSKPSRKEIFARHPKQDWALKGRAYQLPGRSYSRMGAFKNVGLPCSPKMPLA